MFYFAFHFICSKVTDLFFIEAPCQGGIIFIFLFIFSILAKLQSQTGSGDLVFFFACLFLVRFCLLLDIRLDLEALFTVVQRQFLLPSMALLAGASCLGFYLFVTRDCYSLLLYLSLTSICGWCDGYCFLILLFDHNRNSTWTCGKAVQHSLMCL